MIRIIGLVLTLSGMAGLILGVFGLFGTPIVSLNSWALTLLGLVFFLAGVSMLKPRGRAES